MKASPSRSEGHAEAVATDERLDDRERHRYVRLALGKAGFTDPGVSTDILSGGWRARLAIARELARTPDLLLLEFPGAIVLVSHDRHLLDRVSTQVIALDGRGGAHHFADYDQW